MEWGFDDPTVLKAQTAEMIQVNLLKIPMNSPATSMMVLMIYGLYMRRKPRKKMTP